MSKWKCPACDAHNIMEHTICQVCNEARPVHYSASPSATSSSTPSSGASSGATNFMLPPKPAEPAGDGKKKTPLVSFDKKPTPTAKSTSVTETTIKVPPVYKPYKTNNTPYWLYILIGLSLFGLVYWFGSSSNHKQTSNLETSPPAEVQTSTNTVSPVPQTYSQPAPKATTINGYCNRSDVKIRATPSCLGTTIGKLKKGDQLIIRNSQPTACSECATTIGTVKLYAPDGTAVSIVPNRCVVIRSILNNSISIEYTDANGTYTGNVNTTNIQRISDSNWFHITTIDGLDGWVFANFITV